LTPLPRVRESLHLAERFAISAMIDITDGLASEINHVCRLSEVGARITADRIPIHQQTRGLAGRLNDDVIGYALQGGEDYELLFTAPLSLQEALQSALHQNFQCDCTCIGEVVAASEGICLVDEAGELAPLQAFGFDHFSRTVKK
jgi:thiamine-monophosphate kinase